MACLTMGVAAGVAAAISIKHNIPPRKIDRLELQSELIASKVNIGQGYREIPGIKDYKYDNNDIYANHEQNARYRCIRRSKQFQKSHKSPGSTDRMHVKACVRQDIPWGIFRSSI